MNLILGIGKILCMKYRNVIIRENGVSPVVGVMLMLVVTIVIAAVVALFATGVLGGAEEAPVAALTAVLDSEWGE